MLSQHTSSFNDLYPIAGTVLIDTVNSTVKEDLFYIDIIIYCRKRMQDKKFHHTFQSRASTNGDVDTDPFRSRSRRLLAQTGCL